MFCLSTYSPSVTDLLAVLSQSLISLYSARLVFDFRCWQEFFSANLSESNFEISSFLGECILSPITLLKAAKSTILIIGPAFIKRQSQYVEPYLSYSYIQIHPWIYDKHWTYMPL